MAYAINHPENVHRARPLPLIICPSGLNTFEDRVKTLSPALKLLITNPVAESSSYIDSVSAWVIPTTFELTTRSIAISPWFQLPSGLPSTYIDHVNAYTPEIGATNVPV